MLLFLLNSMKLLEMQAKRSFFDHQVQAEKAGTSWKRRIKKSQETAREKRFDSPVSPMWGVYCLLSG